MEEQRNNYRTINIVIAVLGLVLCVGAFFIPAPAGLLADESCGLLSVLPQEKILVMFAVPTLMVLLSAIVVMNGRRKVLPVIMALAGGALFAWMDVIFAMSSRSCYGTLTNSVGIVLAVTAALLQALGTPTTRQLRKEQKIEAQEEKEERTREARIFFDDEEADYGTEPGSKSVSDDTLGIDINALRYEALRIESKDMLTGDISTGTQEEVQSANNSLEAMLRNEIEKETVQSDTSEEVINTETLITAAEEAAKETAETKKDETAFYGGLEELFLDE